MTSNHHPPPSATAAEAEAYDESLVERWTRAAVDLLVPASMESTSSTSSTSSSSSSSTTQSPKMKKRSTKKMTTADDDTDDVRERQEDMRLKWLVVIFTICLFLVFQLLSVCTMSMAVELVLVWLLYATRDLPLVASSLAGVSNIFILGLALFSSSSSSSSLVSSGDLLVWLVYGPLLVFLVCGERRGLYAVAAVVLQAIVLSITSSSSPVSADGSSVVRVASNVAAVACIGALAYAGERTRARTERRLRAALAQCAESRHDLRTASETKQKFLANMSHELRTPLHGITATALELLETLSPADKAARECCQLIAECGRLMRSLIEDILDFEQIESNRLMLDKLPFDVVHEVERAVRVLAGAAAKKSIELDVSTAGITLPLHVGDPLRFRQIVFNLLSNAIKFTPEGGRIRVSATGSDANPEEINVEVADNGIGIGADHQPYLFVGFSQEDNSARRRNGGTGLGLAISKSLCEAMGGSIGCRSAPGKGSTFHFTVVLPVAVPTAAEAPTTVAPSTSTTSATTSADSSAAAVDAVQPTIQQESPSSSTPSPPVSAPNSPSTSAASLPSRTQTNGGFRPLSCSSTFIPSPLTVAPSKSPVIESSFNGVRVLLVEDNLVNQKVGVRMLSSLGCSVQVAVNGEECLRILEAAETRGQDNDDGHDDDESNNDSNNSEFDRGFDAVLMDCQMPVMDGFQATSLIRERERKHTPARRPLPVIALTASATKEYREQCFLSGMNDWLAKPFTKANLAHMLRKWARPELAGECDASSSSTADQDGNRGTSISHASAPADICT